MHTRDGAVATTHRQCGVPNVEGLERFYPKARNGMRNCFLVNVNVCRWSSRVVRDGLQGVWAALAQCIYVRRVITASNATLFRIPQSLEPLNRLRS